MEQISVLELLRAVPLRLYHAKPFPEQTRRWHSLGLLADRVGINIELPGERSGFRCWLPNKYKQRHSCLTVSQASRKARPS